MKLLKYILFFLCTGLFAQFAPAVGLIGTTAIHKDSSVIIEWASQCKVTRGYQDISNTTLGLANVGDSSMALGMALSNGVVSLGDGGNAVLQFNSKINDGPGFDFAIFENAFNDTYLEFAFVEVSSDGINYFRFPNQCAASQSVQIASFDTTSTNLYHNLAGKYRAGYGTPFDLSEINPNPLIDLQNITHIKIIDVVGSLNNQFSSFDSFGNKINDPFPTPFPSSGFDLDAVGVIHVNNASSVNSSASKKINAYPNPCSINEKININGINGNFYFQWSDAMGTILLIGNTNANFINAIEGKAGIYYLKIIHDSDVFNFKIIIQ